MKILAIVLSTLVLTGCSVFLPVNPKFPDAIPELKEKCPELLKIEGNNVAITDMLKTIVQNYNTYYLCANKVEGWNEWYEKHKKIYEEKRK